MRLLAVVLLVCLLVTGTVSAITMLPGGVATQKAIKPVTVTVVQTTTPTPGPANGVTDTRGALLVYSDPTGAAITLDGSSTGDVTSQYYPLPAGSHTVKLSLAGYQDYTETFTITPHELWSIHAPLKQKLSASALPGVVDTQEKKIPASALQGVVVSEADWITVNIDSVPSNATVTQLRSEKIFGKTPLRLHLSPDTYYVTLSYPLYQDKTISFNQNQDIMVTLEPLNVGPATVQKAKAAETMWWGSGIAPANPELKAANYSSFVTLPTTPMQIEPCPKDWSCLTPAEAKQQFGLYAMYGNTPCGLEDNPGSPWGLATIKYCCRDSSLGTLPQGALAASDIKEGDDIYIINDTWIEHGVVKKSPAEKETGNAAPWQPLIDFISGLFGGKTTPVPHLIINDSSKLPPPIYTPTYQIPPSGIDCGGC